MTIVPNVAANPTSKKLSIPIQSECSISLAAQRRNAQFAHHAYLFAQAGQLKFSCRVSCCGAAFAWSPEPLKERRGDVFERDFWKTSRLICPLPAALRRPQGRRRRRRNLIF